MLDARLRLTSSGGLIICAVACYAGDVVWGRGVFLLRGTFRNKVPSAEGLSFSRRFKIFGIRNTWAKAGQWI